VVRRRAARDDRPVSASQTCRSKAVVSNTIRRVGYRRPVAGGPHLRVGAGGEPGRGRRPGIDPYGDGGRTHASNLKCLCRIQCHTTPLSNTVSSQQIGGDGEMPVKWRIGLVVSCALVAGGLASGVSSADPGSPICSPTPDGLGPFLRGGCALPFNPVPVANDEYVDYGTNQSACESAARQANAGGHSGSFCYGTGPGHYSLYFAG
jgi:hypothetical protein